LEQLANESAEVEVEQGASVERDITPSTLGGDDLGGSTQEAEIEPDTAPVASTDFDYASQLAALQGGDTVPQDPNMATTASDPADPSSYAQQQLARLQGLAGDDATSSFGQETVADSPASQTGGGFSYTDQIAALQGDPTGFNDTQSLGNTPVEAAPPVDPETAQLAEQFRRSEQQIRELRQQKANGMISDQDFQSALRELMIFDTREDVWWMMGADTDIWYKYSDAQSEWIVAEPPHTAMQRQQAVMTPDSGVRQVDDIYGGGQDSSDDWGYSQPNDAQNLQATTPGPSFDDSYQMPKAADPLDSGATMVGGAAFKDTLDSAQPTVANLNTVDTGFEGVESPMEYAPDYEADMGEDLSAEIELAQRRRNRQLVTTLAAVVGVVTGLVLLAAAGIIFYVYSQYQGINEVWTDEIAAFGQFETDFQTVVIQDINGNEIARLRSQDGGDRTNV
ncbi:MAG: hypothetical protein AAF125_23785, partial [Chloroflexota bacterium]